MHINSANKFFDSLAAGKPIAINHGGWQAELLEESGAGVVLPAANPESGAQILSDFLASPEGLAHAGQAARELGRSRFSREESATAFETVLKEAVDSRRSS